jgi:hypothetical protein
MLKRARNIGQDRLDMVAAGDGHIRDFMKLGCFLISAVPALLHG